MLYITRSMRDQSSVSSQRGAEGKPVRRRSLRNPSGNNFGTSRRSLYNGVDEEQIAFATCLPESASPTEIDADLLVRRQGFRAKGDRSMTGTYDAIADLVAKNCDVERGAITPDSHLVDDLGLDSVDLFDLGFSIEDAFNIEVPMEEWSAGLAEAGAADVEDLRMARFCDRIDALREQRKANAS
jgi:acyl carrier protein